MKRPEQGGRGAVAAPPPPVGLIWTVRLILRIEIGQDVAERRTSGRLHLEHARPAGRVAGCCEFCEAVAGARAGGQDEFTIGGEFQERGIGEVGAWPADVEE